MQKSFLVIFEVFLRLNSDLLDMISCFVTAVLNCDPAFETLFDNIKSKRRGNDTITQDDVYEFSRVKSVPAGLVNLARWHRHIASYSDDFSTIPGEKRAPPQVWDLINMSEQSDKPVI